MPDAIRVLIVDDEEDFATALVERLRRRGFAADTVFTGRAALERLSGATYDVAVIVLTGHATVASGIDGMQIGAADFLQKPADLEALCTAIRAAAERAGTANQGEPA